MKDLHQKYDSRIEELQGIIRGRQQTCRLLQLTRGICFILTAASVIAALTGGLTGWAAYIVPALPFAGLILAAACNETIEHRQQRDRVRLYLTQLQVRRLQRKWTAIPEPDFEVTSSRFHLSKDLDLFGEASLIKLIGLANTPWGIQKLAGWLLNPAPPEEIRRRQEAIAALAPEEDLREQLQLLSYSVADAQTEPDELLEWSRGERWLEQRPWLLWFSRCSASAMLICGLLLFVPGAPRMVLGGILLVLLSLHILASIIFAGAIHRIFNSVGYRQRDVSTYVDLFYLARELPTGPDLLDEIRSTLYSGDENAVALTRQLRTIVGLAQMRRSGLYFLVYIILQFLVLLDVHTLAWLESWHKRHATQVADWLEAVATWESLSSLSNLAHQHPDWTFPEVDAEWDRVTAKQLGHPLLPEDHRVCNDVTVGPRDSILLVTGSNMSGKSTLLRSIGLNCALAQAGSVVCAEALRLPPLQIETSMRIGDSVSEGVSFFMAELKRLQQITVEARKLAGVPDRTLLFLLDEILQGTNSRERQIAVISVCRHLLDSGAIGAISTHDLELAAADQLREKCQTVHFREFFTEGEGRQEMHFDYIMRQGVSPTTNALKLLEMVGLGPDQPEPPTDAA